MLVGMLRLISIIDVWFFIIFVLLERLINVFLVVCSFLYEVKLFLVVFLCLYFGLFRVSELVLDSKKGSSFYVMDVFSI